MKKSYGNAGGRRSGPSSVPSLAALGVAALCALLLLLVAALRHTLGASESAAFGTIFLTPFIVAARLAGQAASQTVWFLTGGVLVLGGIWYFLSPHFKRRTPDAICFALLAFQLFWLARWGNSLLPTAGKLSWSALSLPQQLNVVVGVLLLLALVVAWAAQPAPPSPYESSAPSRVTRFLKKRRMPSRIAGAALMALAVFIVLSTAQDLNRGWDQSIFFGLIPAPTIFYFWVILDAIYFGGKKLWQRLT